MFDIIKKAWKEAKKPNVFSEVAQSMIKKDGTLTGVYFNGKPFKMKAKGK